MLSQNFVCVLGLSWFLRCLNQRCTLRTSQSSCFDRPSRCRVSGFFVMDVKTFSSTALGGARRPTPGWMCRLRAQGLAINLSKSILTPKIPKASGRAINKCAGLGYSTPDECSDRSAQVTLCGSQNLSLQNQAERAAMSLTQVLNSGSPAGFQREGFGPGQREAVGTRGASAARGVGGGDEKRTVHSTLQLPQ